MDNIDYVDNIDHVVDINMICSDIIFTVFMQYYFLLYL